MEIAKRKSANDTLEIYDALAQKDSYIEVTEWINGEGISVNIYDSHNNKSIELSYGELDAINYLSKTLMYHSDDNS